MNAYAAAVQMVSSDDRDENLKTAGELIASAADAGASLVVLPENFAFMGKRETDRIAVAEADGNGPIQDFLATRAARHGIWLVGGTVPIKADNTRVYPASLVYSDAGERAARYDKIHLFDVWLPDREEQYRESDGFVAGNHCVVVDTPLGRLGLSVCYDLRFPELYRELVRQGAQILSVPSAFTAATGRAHWETLLRARAIENLCHVIAPNQGGVHASGRETWGDSMLVDPWGRVLDRVASGPGFSIAKIDPAQQAHTRERFPCLDHRRL